MPRKKQVNFNIKIVLALAANKSDIYQYEDVPESVGKNFAKEINALFIQTSAKSSAGIDV
jgi:stress-induced morphogen